MKRKQSLTSSQLPPSLRELLGKPVSYRADRVSELVREFLARELGEVGDFLSITVTAVKMTPDLKHARIYWTDFRSLQAGADAARLNRATQTELNAAAPELRLRMAGELQLRYTPQLFFTLDESIAEGERIEALLQSIKVDKGN